MLSGNSLRQTVHTHCASVHHAAKLVAAFLRVAEVTIGLAESNGSLPSGLWFTSPAGWLPSTGISSETLCSVTEYGLPLPLPILQFIQCQVLWCRVQHYYVSINCVECFTSRLIFEVILTRWQQCDSDAIGSGTMTGRRRCDNMNDFVRQLHAVISSRHLSSKCLYIVRFEWFQHFVLNQLAIFAVSTNFKHQRCNLRHLWFVFLAKPDKN